MKKFLARLKYYLGFRSIIKKDDGNYYVVRGFFSQEARDKTAHQYWWSSVESKKAYCKCATLVEARELFYKPTLPKTEIIV